MSLEEFWSSLGESAGEVNQSSEGQESSESKEQAIARIEKEQKKAAQTRGQIRTSKQEGAALAQFLIFLLQAVESEKIISYFHKVFFHKTKTWSTYVNHKVFVGMLAPFFRQEAREAQVDIFFKDIHQIETADSLSSYVSYLKKLSYTYHDNIALDQQQLLQLIIEILQYFWIIDTKEYTDEQKKDFIIEIVHDLFWIQHKIDVKRVIL